MNTPDSELNNHPTERLNNSFGFWSTVFVSLIVIDQLSKWLAQIFKFTIFKNYNFAFSLPIPAWIMFAIYIVVIILVIRYVWQTWQRSVMRIRFAWLLILAGGLSNIFERIILGYVRDFIPLASGMLNVADFMIIIGALLILTKRTRRN